MKNDKWKMNRFSRRKFLQTATISALGALAYRQVAYPSPGSRGLRLYVGTYTSGESEGIYFYHMDQATGALKQFGSIKASNPSFLAIDSSQRYLYAVNEEKEFGGKPSGAVSAFYIDPSTGMLTFINQQASLGADPCHLTVDRRRRFLLVANYTGGNLSVLPINRNGSLGVVTDLVQHEGSSIKEQQKGAHAHCIILDRANRHALAADLGIDKIMIYRFDGTNGKLQPNKNASVSLSPGAGPRHLTLHPRRKYAYVINELDSTISTFRYDATVGSLQAIETVSTLPKDFSGQSFCADVHVSPSGKFLYGSNRGHDSIVVLAIDERTGRLNSLEHTSTSGKWPRNFTIDPRGRFLLVANQHSNNVVTFKIDQKTGKLTGTGHSAEIPTPVCLKFG